MTVLDQTLARALAHPLRVEILARLADQVASPSNLAPELGASLGSVSYHVRQLDKMGLIELVGTIPRRGALEHLWRAKVRVDVSVSVSAIAPGERAQRA